MQLPFRQGIVSHQIDTNNNPTFISKSNGGSTLDLNVSPDPTIITFIHGNTDYLFEENRTIVEAWTGPFIANTDYWLYWDIDQMTGLRTFGHTEIEPILNSPTTPAPPQTDLHWFDPNTNMMKRWDGQRWQTVIRVFAIMYDEGSVLQFNSFGKGTQVGIHTRSNSGFILFDNNEDPIRKMQGGSRRSEFLTTESVLTSQLSSGAANISIEALMPIAEAIENIPAWRLVTYKDLNRIGLASSNDTLHPVVGMVREDLFTTEVSTFTSNGVIINENWNWSEVPGTRVFCGPLGEITTIVPQSGSIQKVGMIMSKNSVFLDIEYQIILVEA